MPSRPVGKIELWLTHNQQLSESLEKRTKVATHIDVDDFVGPWPWRFIEMHQFFEQNPLRARLGGLQSGDIIVAGAFGRELNAGMVVTESCSGWNEHWRYQVAVAGPGPVAIVRWPWSP